MAQSQVASDENRAMMRSESVGFRRNKRQGMAMSVVERYIRRDIPCALSTCTQCAQNQELRQRGVPLLDAQAARIVVPDASAVSRYIELLEASELNNLVFCQTVLDALDRRNRTRTIRNVRKIAADPRRSSVVFANEVFVETQLSGGSAGRLPGESAAERDLRAVLWVANWYARHIHSSNASPSTPPRVLILTVKDSHAEMYAAGQREPGVDVLQLDGFVAQLYPQLQKHFNEIKGATEGADMDITDKSPLEYAHARIKAKSENGYPDYWALCDVEDGLRAGTLIRGKIRIVRAGPAGAKRQPQGIIERAGGLPSVVISGRLALNRVCPGDTVVVRILTGSEASDGAAEAEAAIGDDVEGAVGSDAEDEEDIAVDQIDAGEEAAAANEESGHLRGTVVYVAERKWRPFVATLQVDEGGSKHLAVPVDASVPKIRIHYMDTAAIADRYFVVTIDGWAADSQYPHGHFVRALGKIGDLDAEIDTILVERQIAVSQAALVFSEASLREMPVDSAADPWTLCPGEIEKRRDLRDTLVFSIDPQGSQDIDDAISMRTTGSGGFELGVHIADVTQFIAPGMATDTEAQARGTTVYLADRRFNMIPEVLSERICSLRGNEDRFAVSVIWTLDKGYNVESVWFGRTVIRSACEMHYEQAQDLLDGKKGVAGIDPAKEDVFRQSIVDLANAMRVLRERRRQNGALELASTEVKFEFHKQTKAVAEVRPKKSLEIHRVIEEAMVFANAAVARRIHQHIPSAALLRRHRSPTKDRFERLIKAAGSKGFSIDCSSNAALAESLRKVAQAASQSDPDLLFLAKSMATLAMQEADYFATGDCGDPEEFVHYGLALAYYTHFTSPIRRYADIVVHRQLLAALAAKDNSTAVSPSPVESRQWVGDVAMRLNERNRQSKLAQRESTELFQSRYVAQQTQNGRDQLVADGIVAEVRTNGLIVYVPRFGLRGPVHLRDKTTGRVQLPLSALSGKPSDVDKIIEGCSEFVADADRLSIRLPINVPAFHLGSSQLLTFAVFDHVKVMLRVLETRRRRAPVYLTLVSQARAGGARAYRSTLPPLEKTFRISAANNVLLGKSGTGRPTETAVPEDKGIDNPAAAEDAADEAPGKGDKGKKKNRYAATYKVLEKFSEMSLLETRSESQRVGTNP
ncbi:hypothetical protein GGI23_000823 [Coemansia sp. RSA 2559]|nr:hypothetical protein GGI23_000823 [Coemansia sp. RSA 2559]